MMGTKIPFIEPYLIEYHSVDEEIKQLSLNNKCDLIEYSEITKDTNLHKFDYIIVSSYEQLETIYENKKFYKENKNKLFFIGDYNKKYFDNKYEILMGINIFIFSNKNKILSNLLQNLSVIDKTQEGGRPYHDNNYLYEMTKKRNIVTYLPSSTKQITFTFEDAYNVNMTNLPNKIRIINFKVSNDFIMEKKIKKLPFKSILFFSNNKFVEYSNFVSHDKPYRKPLGHAILCEMNGCIDNEISKIFSMKHNKIYFSFFKVLKNNDTKKFIVCKNKDKMNLLINTFKYTESVCCSFGYSSQKHMLRENKQNAWKIMSNNFTESCFMYEECHAGIGSFDEIEYFEVVSYVNTVNTKINVHNDIKLFLQQLLEYLKDVQF